MSSAHHVERGVHQVPLEAVAVIHEHPQPDSQLRRRQTRPASSVSVSVRSATSLRSSASKSTTSAARVRSTGSREPMLSPWLRTAP